MGVERSAISKANGRERGRASQSRERVFAVDRTRKRRREDRSNFSETIYDRDGNVEKVRRRIKQIVFVVVVSFHGKEFKEALGRRRRRRRRRNDDDGGRQQTTTINTKINTTFVGVQLRASLLRKHGQILRQRIGQEVWNHEKVSGGVRGLFETLSNAIERRNARSRGELFATANETGAYKNGRESVDSRQETRNYRQFGRNARGQFESRGLETLVLVTLSRPGRLETPERPVHETIEICRPEDRSRRSCRLR